MKVKKLHIRVLTLAIYYNIKVQHDQIKRDYFNLRIIIFASFIDYNTLVVVTAGVLYPGKTRISP